MLNKTTKCGKVGEKVFFFLVIQSSVYSDKIDDF